MDHSFRGTQTPSEYHQADHLTGILQTIAQGTGALVKLPPARAAAKATLAVLRGPRTLRGMRRLAVPTVHLNRLAKTEIYTLRH